MKKMRVIIGLLIVSLVLVGIIVGVEKKTALDSKIANEKKVENSKTVESKQKETGKEKAQENKNQIAEPEKVQKRRVIVIDPGHASKANLEKEAIAPGSAEMKIKDGGGAEGRITKTPEYVVNMKIALKLTEFLKEKGYTVLLTKEEISQSLGNIERAEIGNKAQADLVIRIHADSSEDPSIKGASMLVPAPINNNTASIYKESKRCGEIILDTLVKEVGMANRGVVERKDMTGFNWSTVPVVLVEVGFLSNSEEDKLLSTEEYQNKVAQVLSHGIEKAIER